MNSIRACLIVCSIFLLNTTPVRATDYDLEPVIQPNGWTYFLCSYPPGSNNTSVQATITFTTEITIPRSVMLSVFDTRNGNLLLPGTTQNIGENAHGQSLSIDRFHFPRDEGKFIVRNFLLNLSHSVIVLQAVGSSDRWVLRLGEMRRNYPELFTDLSNNFLRCQINEEHWPL